MKRLLLAAALLLVAQVALAANARVVLTDDGVVIGARAVLGGFIVNTDGTNDVTVACYDDADSADGVVLAALTVLGADLYGGALNVDVQASAGIFCDLTTSGTATVYVYYRK